MQNPNCVNRYLPLIQLGAFRPHSPPASPRRSRWLIHYSKASLRLALQSFVITGSRYKRMWNFAALGPIHSGIAHLFWPVVWKWHAPHRVMWDERRILALLIVYSIWLVRYLSASSSLWAHSLMGAANNQSQLSSYSRLTVHHKNGNISIQQLISCVHFVRVIFFYTKQSLPSPMVQPL